MSFSSFAEFLAMGSHGAYVWSAYGISLAVLCGELTAAWLENEALPLPPSLAKHLAAERYKQT